MHSLLIIAHGSSREASNSEVRDLAKKVAAIAVNQFDNVSSAFLELAEPDIPTGIHLCAEAGATEITIVPYFLSAGRHVVEDIPREVDAAAIQHPSVKINLQSHIGSGVEMPALLLRFAYE
ncbi:MAG: CbiX/SirB N-terminal domain-containing protein [Sedimenticola sp.]|nr:CbiX/SirB N-terminal domain-containing protein [Sedimenticola sp.]